MLKFAFKNSMAFVANRKKRECNDTILTCMSALCLTDEHADVYFSFPEERVERIPAHKLILAIRSHVFKAMFYGTFPQNEGDIKITDIKSDIFQKLMRYLYTDELDLNGTVVISLLYAAQKYQLPALLSKCEVYLSEHLVVNNACTIYSQAKFFSMAKLKKGALEFIAQKAMKIFNSEDFLSLSPSNLLDTLQLDSLCISEVNIFRSVLKWAESKLSQSKKLITGESRRRIMLEYNILYMIGIPLLTLEEYTTVVVPSDVLTDEEQLFVFKAITMEINSDSKITTKFRMRPRKGGNILNLSVDAILSSCSKSRYWDGDTLDSSYGYDQYEVLYFKASATVRIVSAIIKPKYQNYVHNSMITYVVDGKVIEGVNEHGKSLKFEINQDVLPNETLQLHVAVCDEGCPFSQHQSPLRMVSRNNIQYQSPLGMVSRNNIQHQSPLGMVSRNNIQLNWQIVGEHQFRNITKLEHVKVSLDVEGVRMVDSLNIMVLY